ncbi:hypothetical protein ACIRBX_00120 [Kitasatospora sp. NPDC096147]|uniref:hypothetical protein n=1 Tax=Kitasatospora sp. NPDC096147 TaxID=3364093 RepID=UPI0037FFE1C6
MAGTDDLVRVKDEAGFTALLAGLVSGHLAGGGSLAGLARRAGVSENSLANWRTSVIPREEQLALLLEACGRGGEVRAWTEARRRALQARTARQAAQHEGRRFGQAQEELSLLHSRLEQAHAAQAEAERRCGELRAEVERQQAAKAVFVEEAERLRRLVESGQAEADRLRAGVAAAAARQTQLEEWARTWPPFPFGFWVPEPRTAHGPGPAQILTPGTRYIATATWNRTDLYLKLPWAGKKREYHLRDITGITTDRTPPNPTT